MIDLVDILPKHKRKRYNLREISLIKRIVVHHTVSDATPKAIAKYHVKNNKWPGVGYHFMIDNIGEVFRCNKIDVISYNTSGLNLSTIGVALIGNFEENKVPDDQWKALVNLVDDLIDIVGPLEVSWHAKHKATLCPGKHLIQKLEAEYSGCDDCAEIKED